MHKQADHARSCKILRRQWILHHSSTKQPSSRCSRLGGPLQQQQMASASPQSSSCMTPRANLSVILQHCGPVIQLRYQAQFDNMKLCIRLAKALKASGTGAHCAVSISGGYLSIGICWV